MMMTVPEIIWSMRKRMEKSAWTAPMSPPVATATAALKMRLTMSGQWLVLVLATKPAKAPASIMPSMPMLMMPDRSQRMPLSAPSTRGHGGA